MPTRIDLRDLTTNVRDAFADADRDTLLDVLAFVIREYVAEGPPPMLVHQTETLADLRGLSFAQLVTALQTRLEHPELAMFVVDGERVGVRISGAVQPIVAQRTPLAPEPARPEAPRVAAGVRVVETTLAQRPAPRPAPPVPVPAPAPAPAPAPPPSPSPSPGAPAATPAAAAPSDKAEDPGDDASARFSLLELD